MENLNVSLRWGCSPHLRLVGEGLVQSENHQGYFVTPLSEDDLVDLTTARLEIEALVFRQSVIDGDVEWEARAVSAHHILARTPLTDADGSGRMSDEWARVHTAFHDALLSGCRNRRLLETARALRREAELYQRWSVSLGQHPGRDIDAEHRGLLEAALSRDPDLAVERLREHINHTTKLLSEYRQNRVE